jgi:hypothetical protein
MHVWEILKTEKKYVQELEILQAYSQSLLQHSLVAPDTVHLIFSNLGKLLDFQVGPQTPLNRTAPAESCSVDTDTLPSAAPIPHAARNSVRASR